MMNNYILKGMVAITCMVGLSSCLKNKNEQPDFSSTTPLIELPVNSPTGDGSPNSIPVSLTLSETPSDFKYYINYAAAEANPTDLKINLTLDTTLITRYNIAHPDPKDKIILLPAAAYNTTFTATIPAGQRKMEIPVTFRSILLSPAFNYGLPVTITDGAGVTISKNFGSMIIRVGVKNIYDGVYSMKGYVVRQDDTGGLMGYIKAGVTTDLVTDGVNSNGFTQYWANGGGIAGIDQTTLSVDPVTNKVKVFSKANSALVNLPGYDNRYDPATKTFYLSFYWGNGPTHRAATDTLTYVRAR
jgi:hypothetical protein